MKTRTFLPDGAPFTPEQRGYLNGFLAGYFAGPLTGTAAVTGMPGGAGAAAAASSGSRAGEGAAPTAGKLVTVLYGSQSGNSEALAHALGERLARQAGVFRSRVLSLADFEQVDWNAPVSLLLCCSTWGNGDMPDNAVSFHRWLKEAAPALGQVEYAVLGLGDRSYARFCQAGRELDGLLEAKGAKRLIPFQGCDTDFEGEARDWGEAALKALASDSAAVSIANAVSIATAASVAGPGPGAPASAAAACSVYSRKHPFPAPLLENRPLCLRGSGKDVRHITLALPETGLVYEPGDALGLLARNSYEAVDRAILALNANGRERVEVPGQGQKPLRQALLFDFDLAQPTEELLRRLLAATRRRVSLELLGRILSEEGEEELQAFKRSHDLAETLRRFPEVLLPPAELLPLLRKLGPRLYSIASSPLAHPGEVHLTVGVVRYELNGSPRRGLASTFLAESLPLGMTVPIYIQPSPRFKLPRDPHADILCIGPGTGIAPFRGFLHQREAAGAKGRNWLFFGNPKAGTDFLYREEIEGWRKSGHLSRLSLAFSQDGPDKVYVQHRIREEGPQILAWLQGGAHLYVCGDAKKMAPDVDAALVEVLIREGGMDAEAAAAFLARMKKDGRYERDVY